MIEEKPSILEEQRKQRTMGKGKRKEKNLFQRSGNEMVRVYLVEAGEVYSHVAKQQRDRDTSHTIKGNNLRHVRETNASASHQDTRASSPVF